MSRLAKKVKNKEKNGPKRYQGQFSNTTFA
jgi:hypothetical protein